MSHPQRSRGWAYLALAGLVVLGGALANSAVVASQAGGIGLVAEALAQPGLPIEITGLIAHSNNVTRETSLSYTIVNRGTEPLRKLTLSVVVFDGNGNVRGGQVSCGKLNVAPGEEEDRELRLSNLLYIDPAQDYGRIVVGVEGLQSERFAWEPVASFPVMLQAMKDGSPLPASLTPSVVVAPAQPTSLRCPEDFCDKCLARALSACGTAGIKSWNCKVNASCECSFTCRDRNIGEPLP